MARARQPSQLVEVATYNFRILAVKGANGCGRDYSVLRQAPRLHVSVVGLQQTTRAARTDYSAAGVRVFCSGNESGGQHGVGLAVKEAIGNATFTTVCVDESLMTMRFEVSGQSGAISSIAAFSPTEVAKDETKQAFWDALDDLAQRMPSTGCAYLCTDANAGTGKK